MSQDIMLFNSNSPLPAHLAGMNLGLTQALLATVGQGGNRIGLKGSRFRLVINGKEERVYDENYLDVIIVGVVPHISRIYYEGNYDADTKSKPVCYSVDGIAPPIDLPTRQNDKCETCQWNQKGSKIVNGQKMKACGYFQRLVVMLPGDDSGTYYRIDVKAQGIFGDSMPNEQKFNIRDYAKFIANRGVEVAALITRLSFDTNESVPKLLFKPFAFVTPSDFELVRTAVASDQVRDLLKIDTQTIDLSQEQSTDDQAAPAVKEREVTPAASVPQETTIAQQAAESVAAQPTEAPAKKKYQPVPAKLGDFTVQQYLDTGWTKEQLIEQGMIVEVVEAPKPAPAPPQAPPTAPAPPAAPQPPKPAAPPAAQATPMIESVPMPQQTAPAPRPAPAPTAAKPAAATVTETASDAELDDILAGLT